MGNCTQAIILAAGKHANKNWTGFPDGSKPKCLHTINGEILLERNVKLFRKYGIKDIIVVIGYEKEKIIEFTNKNNLNLIFVHNDTSWDTFGTAPFESFRLGLEKMRDESFILCMGDVVFSEQYLLDLLNNDSDICLNGDGQELRIVKINKKKLPNDFDFLVEDTMAYPRALVAFPFACGFYNYLVRSGGIILSNLEFVELDNFKYCDEGHPDGLMIQPTIKKLKY